MVAGDGDPGPTGPLAAFLSDLTYARLPQEADGLLKGMLLDVLGTTLAANTLSGAARQVVELALQEGGTPQSTVLGFGGKVPVLMGAFANGALAHALNYDDWGEGGIHAGATTVPAALAVAEHLGGIGGRQLLTALAAAAELECRLAAAIVRTGAQGRWVLGQLVGYFGAAVAAGRVLGLDRQQMHSALGLALAQAAGTMQMVVEGDPPAKSIYAAFPNQAGVLSAWLAKGGLGAQCSALEGEAGLLAAYLGLEGPFPDLLQGLGEEFYLTRVRFKPWPVSGIVQPFLEGALELSQRYRLETSAIARVHVSGGEHIRPWCEPLPLRRRPPNPAAASDSIPYAVAKALVQGDFGLADLTDEGLQREDALQVAERVTYAIEPHLGESALLTVVTWGGDRYAARVDTPLGHPRRPVSYRRLAEKFRRCAAYAAHPLPPDRLQAVVDMVERLEELEDVTALIALLTGDGA